MPKTTKQLVRLLFYFSPAFAFAQGSLTNGANETGAISSTSQTDNWTFSITSGQSFIVSVSSSVPSPPFDLSTTILRPDSSVLYGNYDNSYTRFEATATESGTYTVSVKEWGGNPGTNTYVVTVFITGQTFSVSSGDEGGPIISGENYNGAVYRGDIDPWTFNLNNGDSFIVSASSTSVSTPFDPLVYIFNPDGSLLYSNYGGPFYSFYGEAAQTGTYSVVVAQWSTVTNPGAYLLTYVCAPGGFSVPPGDEGGPMTNGVVYNGAVYRGDLDPWSFNANSGDYVTVKATGSTSDVNIYIFSPDGARLFSNYGSTISVNLSLSTTGTYTIVASHWGDASDAGGYTVMVTGATGEASAQPGKDLGMLAGNEFCDKCPGVAPVPGDQVSTGAPIAVAEPISLSNGNLFEQVTDYSTIGPNPLAFIRYYNSQAAAESGSLASTLGVNWRSNFDRYVRVTSFVASVERPNGRVVAFTLVGSTWTPDTDIDATLTNSGTTWIFTDSDDTVEAYTQSGAEAILNTIKLRNGYTQTMNYTSGQLTSVSDSYGRALTLTYTAGLLQTVSTPDTLMLTYGFTATGEGSQLTGVSFNTTPVTGQTYYYEDASFPFALTGIQDELGNRYATWAYDSHGRANLSKLAGGANSTQISYDDTTGNRTVTGPLGNQETYKFTMLQGLPKVTEIDCAAIGTVAAATRGFTYDSNGYLATATDWNGNSIQYKNNSHGRPTMTIEAFGSNVARTTTVVYDATWVRLPHTITTQGLTTTLNYDPSFGNLLTKVDLDTTAQTVPYSTNGQSRTTTYTYTATGQLQTVQLPRTDVTVKTTYNYTGGTLTSIVDPLNHTTTINTYTGGGLPLTITDPNNVVSTLTYDARLRLNTKVINPGSLTTTWNHDAAGNLIQWRPQDGYYLSYGYDAAHRLTSITNANGELMPLTLDANGDVTQTLWQTAAPTTLRTHTASFDAIGRQLTDVGGMSQTTTYGYDSQGNRTGITTPLTWATGHAFDALNRLQTVTDPYAHTTGYTYDAHDRTLTVTDPNGHATTYVYDGFGEAISVVSPDSGKTVYHYDQDGNVSSKTDAASQTTTWTYDAMDRPLTRTYTDKTLNVAYTYDQITGHTNGITRLTSVIDQAGSLSLSYDQCGNITSNARVIAKKIYTTSYTYFSGRSLASIAYPTAGWIVSYARDAAGQVNGVTATQPGHAAVNIASAITHLPFGPVSALSWGNGVTHATSFDADYRQTGLTDAAAAAIQNLAYVYDADNNLHMITDAISAASSQTLGYDHLERLTSAVSGTGGYGTLGYIYDNNGNRTASGSTKYKIAPTSNRLAAIGSTSLTYLATGNIETIGTGTKLTYNKANQLATATSAGSSGAYSYDAFGSRLKVQPPTAPLQVYSYDLTGNLLTETDNSIETDYIYLDGTPIATIQPGTATISYLHADHLGTPQLATNASKATVFSAQYQPFGGGTPTGSITQNLKMPGQYGDNTGFFHNGFRDYNPAIGRYLESDPIGLAGGTNTYAYVGNNPAMWTDTSGLIIIGGGARTGALVVICALGLCHASQPGIGEPANLASFTLNDPTNFIGDLNEQLDKLPQCSIPTQTNQPQGSSPLNNGSSNLFRFIEPLFRGLPNLLDLFPEPFILLPGPLENQDSSTGGTIA